MPEGTENLQETPQTMGSALSALEGLAGSELIAAEMKNQNPGDDNNEVQEQQEEQPENQNGEAGDQNEVADVVEDKNKVSADQEDDLSEEEKNNPLLTAIKGKKGPEVKFENIDQVKAHAKKHLGIEIKSENDFGKLFNSATEWRKKAQKADELEETVGKFEAIFDGMPKHLLESVKAFYAGQPDWETHVTSKPKFDFSKPIDQQNIKTLVQHYYPNKFNDEDWTAEERPQALDIAIQAAKDRFTFEKREVDETSAKIVRESSERKERMKTSTESSLNHLKDSFPDMDSTSLKKISSILESGDVNSMFFDKNGVKKDAAKKLILALHGEETIKNMMKLSAKRSESSTNEEILSRGADKPKPQKGNGSQQNGVNEKVSKQVESLLEGLNKKRTY